MAWGTGTGKTYTAILLAEKNIYPLHKERILVVVPKSLKDQWVDSISRDAKHPLLFTVMTKEEFKRDHKTLSKFSALIIDEGHYFSNFKSAMAKSLMWYVKAHDPRCIYLLTATPYMSSVWNIFTLGKILGQKFEWYKWDRFFFTRVKMGNRMVPIQKKKIDGISTEDYVTKAIKKFGSTVKLEDSFDVPEQQFFTEYFALTKEQNNAIDNLTDVVAISRWTRIHQICGGSLKGDGYVDDQFFKSQKLDRLIELAKEHKKMVVVCRYTAEIEYLAKELKKYNISTITGKTKGKNELVKRLHKEDEAIVIVNAACSEGYSLESFPVMVFYSYDYSLKNYIQIIGRILRSDHLKKNVYISLVVKGTIDEAVYKCIGNKKSFDESIYDKKTNLPS